MTGGKGVDVIINSVAGDALRLTWNCIAPFGRFIELGKRDFTVNSRLEMKRFARNVTFAAVDLVGLIKDRPDWSAEGWAEVMALIRKGDLKPPTPIKTFGFSEIEQALRIMQTGKHMGKLVAMAQPNEIVKVRDSSIQSNNQQSLILKAIPPNTSSSLLKSDGSYLLVGGLGGLGRTLALWMLKHGARSFIFASRSGLAKQEAKDLVAILEAQGAKVAVFNCDISNGVQFDEVLAETGKTMPRIRGVIQSAMVLRVSHMFSFSLLGGLKS